jgi:hypothetical protein
LTNAQRYDNLGNLIGICKSLFKIPLTRSLFFLIEKGTDDLSPLLLKLSLVLWAFQGQKLPTKFSSFRPFAVLYKSKGEKHHVDEFPIAKTTSIGSAKRFLDWGIWWVEDGIAFLTNAQLYDNSGTAVGAVQLVVNIPVAQITYELSISGAVLLPRSYFSASSCLNC